MSKEEEKIIIPIPTDADTQEKYKAIIEAQEKLQAIKDFREPRDAL